MTFHMRSRYPAIIFTPPKNYYVVIIPSLLDNEKNRLNLHLDGSCCLLVWFVF
jgi:hypothetical protein